MVQAHQTKFRLLFLALFGALLVAAVFTRPADATVLKPPPGKVFFGATDTGDGQDFRDFARAVGKHPSVIQTFHPWDNSWHSAMQRWKGVRARPMLHITTRADDGTELITPKQIARGKGDAYLLRINASAAKNHLRMYIRPLGEPNRCLNYYAGVDCSGNVRGGSYAYKWYRSAFRRIAIITKGGGKRGKINARLHDIGLPKVQKTRKAKKLPRRLRKAPVSIVWGPLPAGSPKVSANAPAKYWPGKKWVDWVSTDFYNRYNNWKDLGRFYKKFALGKNKPMALAEWGLWGADGPGFVKRIFKYVRKRDKLRMLIYYQDFGSSNPFRIQNFPRSRKMLSKFLQSSKFPKFAPGYPRR
ncbi:MAG: hypothetical protein J0H98_10920 [Solirubrobacterales bacterium]|nr:hypothetical protein [Solirubrobacterales bacterium]